MLLSVGQRVGLCDDNERSGPSHNTYELENRTRDRYRKTGSRHLVCVESGA